MPISPSPIAIVTTAHAQKIPVAIHSYGASGVRDAVHAGADSVELLQGQLRARIGGVEGSAHPLHADVEFVQFGDPTEQLLVQAEDVPYLGTGTHPVLGGEAEHREPADVAGDRHAYQSGEVLLALGVAVGARQVSPLRPAPVAIHDDRDVRGQVGLGQRAELGGGAHASFKRRKR